MLAIVLAVLRLHTYIIVRPSGKYGSWHLFMNIMCCFSKSWEQPLNNILQGVVSPQVAYISLHPLRLCKHIDQTQGPMSYPLLLTGKVSLFSLSPLPMFKQFLQKKKIPATSWIKGYTLPKHQTRKDRPVVEIRNQSGQWCCISSFSYDSIHFIVNTLHILYLLPTSAPHCAMKLVLHASHS